MQKREQLYEGKAKRVYATDDPDVVIVSYKDDATAFDGRKKGTIEGKGSVNNRMTNYLMQRLEESGIPTHFVRELSDSGNGVMPRSPLPLYYPARDISVLCKLRNCRSFRKTGL
jgi:phosphoribosylaminoimidazole-succinocarboxamide synthase